MFRVLRVLAFALVLIFGAEAFASVNVNVNGSTYVIPQKNEKGWGDNVTTWIQAISAATLQPNGGTFTLTSDAYFGANFGLVSQYYKSATPNIAGTGVLRLAKSDSIGFRNNANSSDLLLGINGSDQLTFNSVVIPTASTGTFSDSGFAVYNNADNTKKIALDASAITPSTTKTLKMANANVDLANINAATITTGNLPSAQLPSAAIGISNGGTNNGSLSVAAGAVPYFDGTKFMTLAPGSSGNVLTSGGAGAPTWTSPLVNPMSTGGDIIYGGAAGAVTRLANGTSGQALLSTGGTTAPAWTTIADSSELINCSIATSVGSSALTVTLNDASGSTPSATSPCKIAFRNATSTTGTYSEVLVTSSATIVISSGSTLGCTNAVPCTLYVYAVNNAGTVVLAVGDNIMLDEGSVQTTTVLAGSGADDNANVMYTTAAQTSKAVRLLGRVTITEAAAGTWASNASEISNAPFERLSLVTASSGIKTPTASGNFNTMTGNSITLTPGTWLLFGSCNYNNSGSAASFTQWDCLWAGANGADSGSSPALITSVSGLSLLSAAPTTLVEVFGGFTTGIASSAIVPAQMVVIKCTQSCTVFLDTFTAMTTAANARISAYLNAERIQ